MGIIEGAVGRALTYAGVPVNGTSEVQTLTIGGTPTSGTFKLAFEGFNTAAITWSSTNNTLISNINTALRALASLGASEITAAAGSLSSGIGTVTLTFGGNRGKQAIGSLITVADNSLAGTGPTLAIAETTPGVDATGRGAPVGQPLLDTTNGVMYVNAGTALAPSWVKVPTLDANGGLANLMPVLTKSADYTLTATDSGALVIVTGVDKVLTLPATVAGLVYTIVLAAAGLSAGTGLSISPNASDKIIGNGFTAADDKDAILAGSDDRAGDAITLVGDGVDGWYITSLTGTWTRQA